MKKAIILFIVIILSYGMTRAQDKITLNVKDIYPGITKYIKKNYEGYKAVEAYKYYPAYVMTIRKGDATEKLVFNTDGKFLYKATEADKSKVSLQTRYTLSLNEVVSGIKKYIKNNFEGYILTEAFRYDEVYTTMIVKGAESETLLFDKEGKFVMKTPAPLPGGQTKKTESVPANQKDPKMADTAKN
jgi:hypothetical protein